MNKLKITTGEWAPVNYGGYYQIQNTGQYHGSDLFDANATPRAKDNITLSCDAGNTYQKCGLLPSELLKQEVTDEDIEKWASIESQYLDKEGHFDVNYINKRENIIGAKAFRDGKIKHYEDDTRTAI